jgi:hypothetical protein
MRGVRVRRACLLLVLNLTAAFVATAAAAAPWIGVRGNHLVDGRAGSELARQSAPGAR